MPDDARIGFAESAMKSMATSGTRIIAARVGGDGH
jgi:hypothetical protein